MGLFGAPCENFSGEVRVVRLCRQSFTDLIALDGPEATAVGLLLASSGTSDIV